MTCLVEVKISRGDYCGDRKWSLAQPTDLAYVAVPSGMVREEEWALGWGVLDFAGEAVRCRRPPAPRFLPAEQQRDIILQIAVRRDHHTRYERHREWQKERAEQAERKALLRYQEITGALLRLVRGDNATFEETLYWFPPAVRNAFASGRFQDHRKLHGIKPLTPEEIARSGSGAT